ncbi:MAG: bifunctional phosphopantothenoylcysteine decarboxylase/phosphopantothenate--cysteine ligase CoaBC [Cyanobacterium sp. T60_A2020_053]|nr:bifunctional phosphopantothenoylcysteine decarboxylase/phosphopantothenate--cysteine ligase CoaBC [Cyanobacterium sp. T60_A2020_053]
MTNHDWQGKKILVGIGGGIASYKVCGLISQLFQREALVRVILTKGAEKFITPLTVATLSRHQAYTDDEFWRPQPKPLHIQLGEWADLMVIAPLTANTLAKLVYGMADNLLTNTVLASLCPILVAPAMNTEMWQQPTVQENWQRLGNHPRFIPLHTNTGLLACDRQGTGRMAEVEEILTALQSTIITAGKRDLVGRKVLISAGGTREFLDPVRFIGNPSTGKMGIALACACHYRGANVTLVGANIAENLVNLLPPVNFMPVVTAEEMEMALSAQFKGADWLIMAAAVADVKPKQYFSEKISKDSLSSHLELAPVTDIVAQLASSKQSHQKIIGFAAQTGDIEGRALEKLQRKGLDAIVANAVDQVNRGFGVDTNEGIFISKNGIKVAFPYGSKLKLAHEIINQIIG